MIILRALLFPFALIYDLATRIRNHLYDIGHKKSFRFDSVVVGVGNLNTGGSGKTPMIEYLSRLLMPRARVATLSRGYGRKTKGLRFATLADSADTIGDEPFQFFRKFGRHIQVTVCEDRAYAIPHILQLDPPPSVILLDDAFQHRAVVPQLSILLTDYASPFFEDYVLPTGNLREARTGARRSNLIVVTKCPADIPVPKFDMIVKSIDQYAPGVPLFFTRLEYGDPVSVTPGSVLSSEIVMVTGIANSKPMGEYLGSKHKILRHFSFRDHYRYTANDLKSIQEFCRNISGPVSIVTTEKDMARLVSPELMASMDAASWFYLPIGISFLKNGSDFDRLVLQSVGPVKQSV